MNVWDIIIISAIVISIAAAIFAIVKRRKKGKGCCGSCSGCGMSCGK
ncbi:MAG: FeoB-associated Cys-rich membrane protein [Acutalibacteraceae bacterium]